MDIKQITKLTQQGESKSIEFKTSTSQIDAAFETITAFLNGDGGTVLIGVKNHGEIVGQEVSDQTRQKIAATQKKIEPHANINIEYIEYQKKIVIAITVTSGKHKPYDFDGRSFQRNESSTIKMSQHRREELIKERNHLNHNWDEFIDPTYGIELLDRDEINKTIEDGVRNNRLPNSAIGKDINKCLTQLKLLDNNHLTKAAIVLFAKKMPLGYLHCELKLARFRGTDKLHGFIDNKQELGNAFYLLGIADKFIRQYIPISGLFDPNKFKRIDNPALPVLAVREALINAIIHRDYSYGNASISLAIYDDRLEIWSSGTLPYPITIEELKSHHASNPRNKLISAIFYFRGYFESWGTGTNNIITLCKEHGIPEPIFSEYSRGFSVTFKFGQMIGNTRNIERTKMKLTSRQKNILDILSQHKELSSTQILKAMKEAISERYLRKELKELKSLGYINTSGKGPKTVWFLT